jgi:hypothetical protein
VVAGLRRMASSRHTKTATPTSPAKPPREDRAATTALVSKEETGAGRGPVAFWIYAFITNFINKIFLFPHSEGRVYPVSKYVFLVFSYKIQLFFLQIPKKN